MSQKDNSAYRLIRHEDEHTYDAYTVGRDGVTRIRLDGKAGEYATVPYAQVWKGEELFLEASLHKCSAIIWSDPSPGDDGIPF